MDDITHTYTQSGPYISPSSIYERISEYEEKCRSRNEPDTDMYSEDREDKKEWGHTLLHHTQYVTRPENGDESSDRGYSDLCEHPFLCIISPENATDVRRKEKSEPYHECNLHPRYIREDLYQVGKSIHNHKCRNKLRNHEFPHTFHEYFHFFIWDFLVSMMNTLPEFTEDWTMPERRKDKWAKSNEKNCHPRESDLHRKIEKE